MRKVNLWNRLFHSGDLLEQEKQYQCLGIIIDAYPSLKKSMEAASSLGDLLVIHRQAWGFGFQNEKLGPCSYGMFRAMNILEMKPEEVFLGNIYGLCTFNIIEWEQHKEETMAGNGFGIDHTIRCYDLVMQQYYRVLFTNFNCIYNHAVHQRGRYQLNGWTKKSVR